MTDKFALLQSYEALCQGLITRESLAVLNNSRGGVACSAHPASVTVGSFANPQLGATVLVGKEDLDFALPGALPVTWQRQYSSRVNPEYGAACGLLGYGWHLPTEISLESRADRILVFDAAGRVITFSQPLERGGQRYSRSEDIWLLRGGKDSQGQLPAWSRQQRFAYVSAELAGDEHCILVSSGTTDILWVFAPSPVTEDTASNTADKDPSKEHEHNHDHAHNHNANPVDPHASKDQAANPVGQRWRLTMQVDRFGRGQRYQYSQGSEADKRYIWRNADGVLPAGRLIAITDGMNRRYRLYHQRIHAGKPARDLWGADDGWRLAGVELERDPHHFNPDPILLVRYGYDRSGQLITVHDRTGELVREFEWHNRRINGHCHRGGPWHRHRYEGVEPDVKIVEYALEQGQSYRFEYQDLPFSPEGKAANATIITDSLLRTETYRFTGLAGLNRLTEHHRADGTVMRYRYNSNGRLSASIDPLERQTSIRYDMQGNVIEVQQPGKGHTVWSYDQTGHLTASYDPTGAVIRYQYDDWGRRIQATLADERVERYHYPDPKEQPLICDRPTQIEDANGGVNRLQYNDAGQLVSYTDRLGYTTLWDYDRWGDPIEATNPLSNTTRYERDPAGRITTVRLPNGQTQHYQYDRQGNITRFEPDENTPDSVLQINRDPLGHIIRTTLGGLSLQMNWDEAGRLITLINENGAQSRFVWDAMDRLVQETGFDGRVQRYQWDAAGQLVQASDGSAAQAELQAAGQAQACHYRWNEIGHLIERQLPATQASDGQRQRYEWDEAGRLKTASVYLIAQQQEQAEEQLQSRIEIERDALGHITSEMQRLYLVEDAPTSTPSIEYEHRVTHKFDPSGSQQESELQNTGQIQWLFDDSGQVRSLVHNSQSLIDFERNALHREVKRQWHILQSAASTENPAPALLTQISHWDSLGRLQDTRLDSLPLQAVNLVPPVLVDQITRRQYRYDALGQIIALQTPSQTLRYDYDTAGRLRTQGDSLAPQAMQQWDLDPAGNRLPGRTPAQQEPQGQDWAELVHWRWKDPSFNLLAPDATPARKQDPIDKWPDNRIGFYRGRAWHYDAQGNRAEQIGQDANGHYSRQRLLYDGGNRLAALYVENVDAQGNVTALSESRYIYDALGRRLKKTVKDQEQEHITYYGWEGDRLVHTERMKEDGTRDIVHTIYEPNSFTPLIRLSTTAKGAPQTKPHLVVQAIKAAIPKNHRGQLGMDQTLAMVQNILTEIPENMQKKLEETLQNVLKSSLTGKGPATSGIISKVNRTNALIAGISKQMEETIQKITNQHDQAILKQMPGMAYQKTSDVIVNMRDGLDEMKRAEQGPISIHFYFCNHLGTPLALIDQQGNIAWAAKLDPWGNIEEEFNPHDIDQPIRLPGQYHDRETGLYYNIDKYYDPQIGVYINKSQTEINGINKYHHSSSLTSETNPFIFQNLSFFPKNISSDIMKPEEIVNFNLSKFIRNLNCINNVDAVHHLPVSKSGGARRTDYKLLTKS